VAVKESLRVLRNQLSLLTHQVGAHLQLYSGMNTSMDEICARYTDSELELLADFLSRTTAAGRDATDELAGD
jgi:hypothetical protein